MNLGELKQLFDGYDDRHIFEYGLGDVFSWRGSYDKPCFSIEQGVSAKHCKEVINEALSSTFYGWKGGEYTYDEYSPVNFEVESGSYTDGGYFGEMLEEIYHSSSDETMLLWLKINKG